MGLKASRFGRVNRHHALFVGLALLDIGAPVVVGLLRRLGTRCDEQDRKA
jgi:hypothetical protein